MSMKVDPGNHTRWKHGTNRGWGVGQNCLGMVKRRRAEHEKKKMPGWKRIKRDFVSFALGYDERSVAHRPKIGGKVQAIVDEEGTEETGAA